MVELASRASHVRRRPRRSRTPETCFRKYQRLHESHPWLQADAHAGQVHVEQPQLPHLAAQAQEPEAQPQVEEQEQAMLEAVEESWFAGSDAHGESVLTHQRQPGKGTFVKMLSDVSVI